MAYTFQVGSIKTKLPMEYENLTQRVLFSNAVLAALMSGRKYDILTQNFLIYFHAFSWAVGWA
jgi:hypothetical protein